MEYTSLSDQEKDILRFLVNSNQITVEDLPKGIWIGLDSMGPARNSKTDALFEGMEAVLHNFTSTMQEYDLGLDVATNGPPVEGRDILNTLDRTRNPRAFAATEGGGLIVHYANGSLDEKVIAPQQEICDLEKVEEYVKSHDVLMKALFEDTESDDDGPPIRTPYETNIVLTIPGNRDTLQKRLRKKEIHLGDYGDWSDKDYVGKILEYARDRFAKAVQELGLSDSIGPEILKKPNRRVYEPVQHIVDGEDQVRLTKYNGVVVGARTLGQEFDLDNSIYVADNVVDETKGEGSKVLGGSERSMIKNGGKQARMAINVTMKENDAPRIDNVEGVKVLHIGSGAKALEAIDFLYRRVHDYVAPAA
jgi:hypothetical protein